VKDRGQRRRRMVAEERGWRKKGRGRGWKEEKG
jgi:hypothetical protein